MSRELPDDRALEAEAPARSSRGRLRRSARKLMRVGAILLGIALVVALVSGLMTRSLLDDLRTNSAELLDGDGTVQLTAGTSRTLYVTGGLVAPGEMVPTPVRDITCTVEGPGGPVPVSHLKDEDKVVGIDNPLARFQVVGSFRAAETGNHALECTGLGVVVAPEVNPASALLRVGGLALGSLGAFTGLTLLLIGAVLALFSRRTRDETDDDDLEDDVAPPEDGADQWWQEEARSKRALAGSAPAAAAGAGQDDEDDLDGYAEPVTDDAADDESVDDDEFEEDEDGYIELTDEELAAMSEEEIAELLASGALVYVDEDGRIIEDPTAYDDSSARDDTYR